MFTVTNAEGEILTHGEEFSGSIDILERWELPDDYVDSNGVGTGFVLRIPYSARFIYERTGTPAENEPWHVTVGGFCEGTFFRSLFGAWGSGSVERVEYDEHTGILLALGKPGNGLISLVLSLPDSTLDQTGWSGWIKLTAMIGGQGKMRLEGQGDVVRFSGVDPQLVLLACGPDYTALGGSLDLEVGSGTLDFSRAAEGRIILQEDGREARILGGPET